MVLDTVVVSGPLGSATNRLHELVAVRPGSPGSRPRASTPVRRKSARGPQAASQSPPTTNGKSEAQWTDQQARHRSGRGRKRAHNPLVVGSSPTRPTSKTAGQRLYALAAKIAFLLCVGQTSGKRSRVRAELLHVLGVLRWAAAGSVGIGIGVASGCSGSAIAEALRS